MIIKNDRVGYIRAGYNSGKFMSLRLIIIATFSSHVYRKPFLTKEIPKLTETLSPDCCQYSLGARSAILSVAAVRNGS